MDIDTILKALGPTELQSLVGKRKFCNQEIAAVL